MKVGDGRCEGRSRFDAGGLQRVFRELDPAETQQF